ncbi:DNA polymerase beta superfamily protein [uncultured Clostridium sp.]|uniref:nucleotidyltransferase domain-containing protein n=1 Tax=uncultured Clostridium sp. TaxID=59620 RepID=UPI00262CF8F8|nr:nucleotidyltransferase domain-containing protein [uncultured Clostridium sp.]
MINLKEIWYSDAYKELREKCGDKLCFVTLGGSHAYGTNIKGSDIDIRGVMLPTKEQLIGLSHFEQQEDSNTDTVIYEFNKYINLIKDCNPNTIEMLGGKQYLIFNEVGEQLINKLDLFLSKKCINTFGGYANAQLRRIENSLCHDEYPEEEKVKHIKQTMDVAMTKLEEKNELFFNKSIQISIQDDKICMSMNFKNIEIGKIRATLNDLLTIEKVFNKLGQRNNKKTVEKLDKHMMHLIRLYHMCFEILTEQKVNTYREKDREFLLEVRNGKFIKDGVITEEGRAYLKELEEKLQQAKEITTLPEKPNYNEIEKFVVDVNTKVINNTVIKYKESKVFKTLKDKESLIQEFKDRPDIISNIKEKNIFEVKSGKELI